MSSKERNRLKIISNVNDHHLSLKEASILMNLSYRQSKRLLSHYRKRGDGGLMDRRRHNGHKSIYDTEYKQNVLVYYQAHFLGYGPTFASEKLAEQGLHVPRETLRLWLKTAGLWQPKRKRRKHFSKRERKSQFGAMLQLDGSHHRWFEDEVSVLMNLVDDATGISLAVLSPGEDIQGLLRVLYLWISRYGIPMSIYVDKLALYAPEGDGTFCRVAAQLGIEIIQAHTPQAKGRVERNHAVYQDRLVKELALANIDNLKEADSFLHQGFIDNLNQRFGIAPVSDEDAHVAVDDKTLLEVLSVQTTRQVNRDWTLRWNNQWYQLTQEHGVKPKDRIVICEQLDDQVVFRYQGNTVTYKPIDEPKKEKPTSKERTHIPKKPSANHPWRKAFLKPPSGQAARGT